MCIPAVFSTLHYSSTAAYGVSSGVEARVELNGMTIYLLLFIHSFNASEILQFARNCNPEPFTSPATHPFDPDVSVSMLGPHLILSRPHRKASGTELERKV